MPFGKYKNKTFNEISENDEGLLYLDWLRGERKSDTKSSEVDKMLCEFLDDPQISKDLDDLI